MAGRILIITERPEFFSNLKDRFVTHLCQVAWVSGLDRAMAILAARYHDIVIVDLAVPNAMASLRNRSLFRYSENRDSEMLVLAFAGGRPDGEVIAKLFESGVSEIFSLSDPEDLICGRTDTLLRIMRSEDELRRRSATLLELMNSIDSKELPSDRNPVRLLVVSDSDLLIEGLHRVAKELKAELTAFSRTDRVRQFVQRQDFALVIVDLGGKLAEERLTLIGRLLALQSQKYIAVMAVSDSGFTPEMVRVAAAGCQEIALLPIQRDFRVRCQRQINRHLERINASHQIAEALHLITTDHLTGLGNRRFLEGYLKRKFYEDNARDMVVLMVDIDQFKAINDTYGHDVGDEVLKELGVRLLRSVRQYDLVTRYGGEEFVAVLPHASEELALLIAERLRTTIAKERFEIPRYNLSLPVRVSVGMSRMDLVDEASTEAMTRADEAMYLVKRMGGNAVGNAQRDREPFVLERQNS